MELYENLRTLRQKKGYSTYAVQMKTGISSTLIARYESGKVSPTLKRLEELAKFYGITVSELLGTPPKAPVQYSIVIGKAQVAEPKEVYTPIPLLKDAASLGPGLEIDENNVEGTALIHASKLRRGGEYEAIRVKGDSMIPELHDGDIVAIDVKQREPSVLRGKLVACHTGGFEVTIKRLVILKDKFWFRATNSKWEEMNAPLIVPKKDGLILGRVVWAWRQFE